MQIVPTTQQYNKTDSDSMGDPTTDIDTDEGQNRYNTWA